MSAATSPPPSTAGPAPVPGKAAKTKRPRSYTIDFMRVILFSCVVMVHTVGTINAGRRMDLLSLLMHYTRYGFVFVTVFVLFLGYYRKDTRAVAFWRRRFGLVVLPYLVWSVLYTLWNYTQQLDSHKEPWPGWGRVGHDILFEVLKGDAKYQLYFLLISMQIYFFFPLLRWVVRKTEGHHGKLFVLAAIVQLGMMFWINGIPGVYEPAPTGFLGLLHNHAWKSLPTYLLLVAIGALAAVHFDRAHKWFMGHVKLLLPLIVLGAAATIGTYIVRTQGMGPQIPGGYWSAADMTLLPWLFASIIGLYLVAAKWNDRRGDGSGIVAKIVDLGSVRAFGVFAAHPLVIDTLALSGFSDALRTHIDGFTGAAVIRSLILVAVTLTLCLVLVEAFLRSPVAKQFVARDKLPLPTPPLLARGLMWLQVVVAVFGCLLLALGFGAALGHLKLLALFGTLVVEGAVAAVLALRFVPGRPGGYAAALIGQRVLLAVNAIAMIATMVLDVFHPAAALLMVLPALVVAALSKQASKDWAAAPAPVEDPAGTAKRPDEIVAEEKAAPVEEQVRATETARV